MDKLLFRQATLSIRQLFLFSLFLQANEHIDVNVATLRGKFSTYVSIPLCIAVVAFTLYTVTEKAYRK